MNKPARQLSISTRVVFDLSVILNYDIQISVEDWHSETPLKWCSKTDESILAEGRFLEAPGLPLFTLEDETGKRISDGIPLPVLEITRLMPAMAFELAQACASSQAASELAESSPLLFILLVDYARNYSITREVFEEFLRLKRTTMLGHFGLLQNKSVVKLISRIELTPLLPWELKDVTDTLRQTEFIELLRHHPNVHLNHLRFLRRQKHPLWPGMLHLVDRNSTAIDITWLIRMIRDILEMAEDNALRLRQVHSRDALQELHDRLVGQFNRVQIAQTFVQSQRTDEYPEAPIRAIDGIEPLTSWSELLDEGVSMNHCVGSYDLRVAERKVFIYRMVHPERLTISLEYRNNRWVLGEVCKSRNANPSTAALDYIRRWVEGLES